MTGSRRGVRVESEIIEERGEEQRLSTAPRKCSRRLEASQGVQASMMLKASEALDGAQAKQAVPAICALSMSRQTSASLRLSPATSRLFSFNCVLLGRYSGRKSDNTGPFPSYASSLNSLKSKG